MAAGARGLGKVPEVGGHVLLAEGGVGRECQVDLPRGGAGGEVAAAVHPRRPHGELVHVVAASTAEKHGRRRRPGIARKISTGKSN